MRIGLFLTCVNDTAFPETGKAVVRLLERLGHDVDFPMAQTCCGQMHVNTGYRPEALSAGPAVRRDLRAVRRRGLPVRILCRHGPRPARHPGRGVR